MADYSAFLLYFYFALITDVDITANVITVPEQLVGYTLTLSNGEDSYTYIFSGTTLSIPQGISGEYELTVTNGNVCYQGEVEI